MKAQALSPGSKQEGQLLTNILSVERPRRDDDDDVEEVVGDGGEHLHDDNDYDGLGHHIACAHPYDV